MKKIILFICIALFNLSGIQAQVRKVKGNGIQVTKERKVTKFTKLEVGDGIDLTILNNPFAQKISLSGEANLLQLVEVVVKDGTLKIQKKPNFEITNFTKNFKVTIASKEIESIMLFGNSTIENLGTIEIPKLSIHNSGSGKMSLNIKSDEVNVQNTNSGEINLAGNTKQINIINSGSGNIHAKALSAFFMSAQISNSGNIYSNVVNGIDGTISGTGNLYYKGTKTVNVTEEGQGKVVNELLKN